ncbi:phage tail sheath family protein [Brevibacillus dissolubilis]|uniref:phage tail sheath family protein n=1 Tax=Brevibacillus dissolubilis TaxID=1844116 RepID=UPI001116FD10|nr:phage tail sheath family protein [Brevibacillus dissolubilis]
MAGGTWIEGVEQVRAGLYINFKAKALERIKSGERGTVTMPLVLNWGESKTFLRIDTDADVYDKLGYDINEPEMLLVREAKKRAKTLLIYRLNEGKKAAVTKTASDSSGTLTVTARYGGSRGGDLAIEVEADPDFTPPVESPSAKGPRFVRTLLKGRVVDEQKVTNVSELKSNAWVTFTGTGIVPETDELKLTFTLGAGETANGSVLVLDHTEYLTATETQHFDVIAYPFDNDPGTDKDDTDIASLKTSFVSFIKRMREQEGKKIQGVMANYDADYEGIVNVANGVILGGNVALAAKDAVAWVAGATAGASIIQSNTYSEYEGAIDVNPRMKNSEIVDALRRGRFLFMHDGVKVKVEKDINSLVTYGMTKNGRFSKNRVLRVLDAIANDFSRVVNQNYIGKLDNNRDGQALLKEAANGYLRSLQDAGAIQNVDFVKDFTIHTEKSVGDEVYATLGVQPVDSMEKFYFNVEVR